MNQQRQYELVYIVSPDATEQDISDLHAQIEAMIARYQGEIVKTEQWGRRKLAYRIGPHREGTYVLEVFKGSGDLTKELDRRLKVIDIVIRHLLVRVDQDLRVAARVTAKRQAEAARRAERGLPIEPIPAVEDDEGVLVDDSEDEAEEE